MKKILGTLVVVLVLLGCAVWSGAEIIYRQYAPQDWPYAYDPNLVQGKALGGVEIAWGKTWSYSVDYSDPDGDKVNISVAGPKGFQASNGTAGLNWQLDWTPTQSQVGMHYAVLTMTDVPALYDPENPWEQPETEQATIFLLVRAKNRPPVMALLKTLTLNK